jgi:endonuclease/exonuclease/phosphatase family metal-dependent hydrolase
LLCLRRVLSPVLMRLPLPLLLLLVTLLAAPPSAAVQGPALPAVGDPHALDVATWNIEHFGSTDRGPSDVALQHANVRAVIAQAEIDLWALQELNHEQAFNDLLADLGEEWGGVWVPDHTQFDIGYGFAYRTDRVQVLEATKILTDRLYATAYRPPLMIRANVTLPGGTVRNLRVINVHAKCCADQTSHERRTEAAAALKGYVDNLLSIDAPVLVLGDLNDELRGSISRGRPSPYAPFLADAANYRITTLALEDSNVNTFCFNVTCSSGSTIDHVVVTRPLFDAYVEGSTARYDALLTSVPSYVNTTSDHVAVHARFDFFRGASAAEATIPTAFALEAPYPNPFRTETTVTYALPRAATVRLEAFDALGRRVALLAEGARAAGTYEATFSAGALPPGLYLVRLTASGPDGEQTATRRAVRVP